MIQREMVVVVVVVRYGFRIDFANYTVCDG